MRRYSSSFRRLAYALTTAHMLIFAAAPYLETASAPSAAHSVTVNDASRHSVPVRLHDAETCPACVLLSAHASQTAAASLNIVAFEAADGVFSAPPAPLPAAPQPGFLSRAPPSHFA